MVERIELRTERLLLRPFRFEDAQDVVGYASDEEYGRYLGSLPQPYSRWDAEEFIARSVLQSWDTRPRFAVVLESKVVGGINLDVDVSNQIAEMWLFHSERMVGKRTDA
jgi:RimJ/RimL family protein N-acetyltransferase